MYHNLSRSLYRRLARVLPEGGSERMNFDADDREEIIRVYRQPLTACTYEVLPAPDHLR